MVRAKDMAVLPAAKSAAAYSFATSLQAARVAAAAVSGTVKVTAAVTGYAAGEAASGASRTVKRTMSYAASSAAPLVPEGLEAAPRRVGAALLDIVTPGSGRSMRRVWARDGRAHIEVRGLSGQGARHRRVAGDVTDALNALKGVNWAQVNAVTRQVLVAFDEQEIDLDRILETVEEVEEARGTADEPFPADEPEHPADDLPLAASALALSADVVGLGVAAVSRMANVVPLPRAARIPFVFADTYPRVRRELESRIGRPHSDLLLAMSSSVANALSHGPAPLAVDGVHHLIKFAEARSRRDVWRRRERELVMEGAALPAEAPKHRDRPAPYPRGPVEKLGDRMAPASLIGAGGMLAFTRDPGRAADLMLATMPKAARQGREAFAAVLGRELCNHGVVPMDATALRRLDRIDVVVVDSAVLCTTKPRVLSAVATDPDMDDRTVWQLAERLVAAQAEDWRPSARWRLEPARDAAPGDADSPSAATLDLVDTTDDADGDHAKGDGRRRGRVRIGCVLDPLADAVLVAARDAADRVLLTEHASAEELLPWADETLSAEDSLTDHVRRLQAEGHGVLVLSTRRHAGLDAADVAIAVLHEADGTLVDEVSWTADLICGPGLTEAWRLLRAVRVARQVSERSCRLAVGGSSLGALLATVGGKQPGHTGLPPVHSAALVAILSGAYSAVQIGRLAPPRPVMRGTWHAQDARHVFVSLRDRRERMDARAQAERAAAAQRPALVHEVAASLARVPGVRRLAVAPAKGAGELGGAIVEELRDPLTPVLALGAAASAVVGSSVDAVLVGGVMAGNAVISASQRLRAERALRGLLLGERINARLVRWPGPAADASGTHAESDTHQSDTDRSDTDQSDTDRSDEDPDAWTAGIEDAPTETVPAERLRPGDVIMLRAADIVPADARLIRAEDLELDESALTGESLPVAKSTAPAPAADLAERACMVYEGCTVVAGVGYAVVVAVGPATEAGRAGAVADAAAPSSAGIQARLGELTRVALPATGVGGLAVTGLSLLRGAPVRQAVASGVAIAVAAVPEGLPLVATVAQLSAARRLSRRGVLVRSSRTLEAVGRVDTFCFDKTGTLTEGRLSVARLAAFDRDLPLDDPAALRLLTVAARACPAVEEGSSRKAVHSTDAAVLEAARARNGADDAWQLDVELPFETNRGYAASLGREGREPMVAVKGAPEVILERCARVVGAHGTMPLTDARRRSAQKTLQELADQGLRVLAVAQDGFDTRSGRPDSGGDLEPLIADLTLVGFVAIADTPRPTAAETVRRLIDAGVRVTVITGDHPRTAAAVARQLGIPGADEIVTGAELDRLAKRQREAKIVSSTVFARVSPEHKVRIVQALQAAGHVVAMTGDGTNDAAAIRLADVGVAVAGRGSVSARNAADLVLTDPDPERIVDAVAEGRALWGSVRDAVSILVGGNGGEVAFTVLGTALDGRAPLGTRQFLLVNMLTDMLPALAVAVAPARPDADGEDALAAGPVADLRGPDLARDLAVRGGATALGATLAWQLGRATGRRKRAATMGLAALVGTQLGQTLVTGRHSPLVVATGLASAAALFAVVETPGVSQFFGCTPLGPAAWGVVGASSAAATAAGTFAPALLERLGVGT